MQNIKEHLAALIPSGAALVLNTLRWAGDIRPLAELKLPAEGKTGPCKSDDYSDKLGGAILALVSTKVEAGYTAKVSNSVVTGCVSGNT